MIQITATQIETNRREVTAYLSLVNRDGKLDGFRLIWTEKGIQKRSKVVYFPPFTPVLEIISVCYQQPDVETVL